MTQVLSFAPGPIHDTAPHLPMDLDRAVRVGGPQGVFAPARSPSPGSSSFTRKRTASLTSADQNHGLYAPLSINTSGPVMKSESSKEAICLCAPTPKIPRPRNAFILYRQHHQSQVTADNPKLSNPEISKIIGEKWKHEVEDVKETWKKLAEEEKQRHQHQYPNYRYQPRRGSKVQGSWPNTASGEEPGRCTKCNGRTIATPRTPSTPVATPPSVKIGPHGQPALPSIDTSASRRLSMDLSPVSTLPLHPRQLPPVRAYEDDPTSPDAKRRRANGAGNYHAVGRLHGAFSDLPPDSMRTSPECGPYQTMRTYPHTTLPELSTIPRSHSGTMPSGPMPPPPRRPGGASWTEQDTGRRYSGYDESLRLPPLQTAVSPSPARTQSLNIRQPVLPSPVFSHPAPQERRSSSTEGAVTLFSFKHKLGELLRITRPLPVRSAEQNRSSVKPRGAIVAVEGPNPEILRSIGQAVEKALLACNEVSLRCWVPDPESIETGGSQTMASKDDISAYLRMMISWQEKSRQMISHVTGTSGGTSTSDVRQTRSRGIGGHPRLETSIKTEKVPSAFSKVPLALLKEGYSLTLSDKFAASTPNPDRYSSEEHWQWMASMWRGIPSADLVVYAQPSEADEIEKSGAVEIDKRMGLIVVRVAIGTSIDEATERRMAFELVEWMRDGALRNSVPADRTDG
ncbi:Repressor of filamentous growth 1 [Beauveria bassiana]|uniref:HMG box protein n=1 Tax=Beauveria bassiana (strain ARSEF 2860) TaxID=655819 RepID=J4KNE7_BEAB2|nr:HMG box protein [Beauveria bassiana ARSEF 2860]EJP65574.1 HMG box protein [Beauveria bassiana ARSEF 2860]KAF1733002.1 Repressor of filamentous growth 1 [Beauveria bassiana]